MKRLLLRVLAALMVFATVAGIPSLRAQVLVPQGGAPLSQGKEDSHALREMLTKGLKATREDEKAYINWIVSLVAKDKLPVSLVYASFKYSRARRPSYPFPYFVFSVETLAKRNNIDMTDDQ